MGRGRSVRDCLVWAFIIGGHVLLILVFMGSKRQVQQVSADAPSPGVLVLLDLPAEPSRSEPLPDAPQLASVPVIPELGSESSAITLPPEESAPAPGSNAIDWPLEAQRSARNTIERNRNSREKRIGEHPPSPFTPKKKPKEFEWDPEPDRVGLAEGFIPYVRIGQRCVVGLGFFGCSLSKLPEANGHLFDGMHDPDRQRSSVPDVDTSSALDPPPD